jgi:small-conductance mechanosensitive channel
MLLRIFVDLQETLWSAGILAGVILATLVAHRIFYWLARRVVQRTQSPIDDSLVGRTRRPARLILPLLATVLVLGVLPFPASVTGPLRHAVGLGLIAAFAWLLISFLDVLSDAVSAKYRIDVKDNLAARRVQTQFRVLRRIAVTVIGVFAFAIMLMTFPRVRQLGTSILASAGVAGLVIGLSARSALANLIAGLQVAFTEPIRIDDVVIVEGEWGWIEEIRTTYVVVRIWDQRRLVVPLSYFIEKPFQNWTRATANLLGTVFVYVDYTVPVEEVRQELHRILKSTPLWDGKVWNVQVTDTTAHAVELRALMSASDSGTAWDLRCLVRERLIAFLQDRYPQCLPRARAEIETVSARA